MLLTFTCKLEKCVMGLMWPKGASVDSGLFLLDRDGQQVAQSHLEESWGRGEDFVPLAPDPPY